ncbi:MAG: M56 family metallopeptidase [Dermatophilaceae bacterium]
MPMLSALLTVAGLLLLAVVLIWPVQRVMLRRHVFRREPLLALLVWQAMSLTALASLLAAGPVAVFRMRHALDQPAHRIVATAAVAITGYMIVRLAMAGHQVGASLRRTRRQHVELLELVGRQFDELDEPRPRSLRSLRVIDHPTPTAYCVPGVRHRVVVSTGMLAQLGEQEVAAVLAHERSHVRSRHDLLVEFFTVLHTAMPARLRQDDVLAEVHLLAEVLADRAAARVVGPVPMGRALVALAGSTHPQATLGAAGSVSAATVRLSLLTEPDRRNWAMAAVMTTYAALVLILPVTFVGVLAAG